MNRFPPFVISSSSSLHLHCSPHDPSPQHALSSVILPSSVLFTFLPSFLHSFSTHFSNWTTTPTSAAFLFPVPLLLQCDTYNPSSLQTSSMTCLRKFPVTFHRRCSFLAILWSLSCLAPYIMSSHTISERAPHYCCLPRSCSALVSPSSRRSPPTTTNTFLLMVHICA